jgi:cell division protein ZapA (FtsZ GTPase activity inhibitor)
MEEKIEKITQKTLIPLSLLLTIIAAVLYISEYSNKTDNNIESLKELKTYINNEINNIQDTSTKRFDKLYDRLSALEKSVSRIEGILEKRK